jgi:hypothetical protein
MNNLTFPSSYIFPFFNPLFQLETRSILLFCFITDVHANDGNNERGAFERCDARVKFKATLRKAKPRTEKVKMMDTFIETFLRLKKLFQAFTLKFTVLITNVSSFVQQIFRKARLVVTS